MREWPTTSPTKWCGGSPTPTCRGRRTRSRGCSATWWRDGSRTVSICRGPTAWSMLRARRRCRRCTSPRSSSRPSGPTSCSPAAWTRSTTCSCTRASRRRPRCRRRRTHDRSPAMPTARCWARAWAWSCSSGSRTRRRRAIGSTRSCVGSGRAATARARRSTPPMRRGRRERSATRTRRPRSIRTRWDSSKRTAPARRSAMPPRPRGCAVFAGAPAGRCAVGSVKSMIGHT
jgi:hypothetical protein